MIVPFNRETFGSQWNSAWVAAQKTVSIKCLRFYTYFWVSHRLISLLFKANVFQNEAKNTPASVLLCSLTFMIDLETPFFWHISHQPIQFLLFLVVASWAAGSSQVWQKSTRANQRRYADRCYFIILALNVSIFGIVHLYAFSHKVPKLLSRISGTTRLGIKATHQLFNRRYVALLWLMWSIWSMYSLHCWKENARNTL